MGTIIYPAVERKPTSIPINEIVSDSGIPDIFPEIRSKGYFDIDFKGDSLVVVAGSHIGQIPLNDRVTIDVSPKTPIGNLIHVISKSEVDIKYLDFFSRHYKAGGAPSANIFEFLGNCLATELRTLVREGVYRQYQIFSSNTSTPRGRFDIANSMRINWSRGNYHRAFVNYFQLDANNPFNLLIKYTLWYTLNHLNKIGSNNKKLIRTLSDLYGYFETLPIDRRRSFIEPVRLNLSTDKLPHIRSYYHNICHVCLAIIEELGVEIHQGGQDLELASFIIDMAKVFEDYLFNILRNSGLITDSGIKIRNGNTDGKKSLFSDNKKYQAKPDIVVERDGSIPLLIDVKYKPKTSENDRYQLITHALSYGAKKAVLALPSEIHDANPLQYIGKIGETDVIELFEYRFGLEDADLTPVENRYIQEILQLAGGPAD